ncbi:STAS domain-containing protein [Paractinoplanes toevensis]|uniref:Anti-sigma factor antagonist n=1 Tax=Paractinoplanes toevensis TaxID=571911 RepID=A0A919VYZ8_9ACTN|nr:STAS domain-containing protein [Actinoplanes toevensis]GIM89597.1 hypothetical protein Ato02nite_013900 [Actinoplanes toevensis]
MLTISAPVLHDRLISVTVVGEIDIATVEPLDAAMYEAVTRDGVTAVVVDFHDVAFCDHSGLDALERAHAAAHARGVAFQLINVAPPVRRVLEIVGMLDLLRPPTPGTS